MKNSYHRVTEEMKDFILKNGDDLTVPEMASLFNTTEEIMYNTVQRLCMPFKRITKYRQPHRERVVEEQQSAPVVRLRGIYDNIRSPYNIYSSSLNIQLR